MAPRILNVDENEAARYAVTRVLRQAGFEVEEAGSADETFRAARRNPSVIVLDIRLPDMDGMEVCRRLKADPDTAGIPVLHLTATYASTKDWAAALEAGADAYLTQPVEPLVLVATIRALLRTREAEAQVRRGSAVLRTTFDAITSGVAVLDPESRILMCNRSMALFLGRPAEELVGVDVRGLETRGPAAAHALLERVKETRQRQSEEAQLGGRWCDLTADPVLDDRGAFQGVVLIMNDITERKRAEAERGDLLASEQAARADAESANRLKDEFLATLSHELRTPLHAILGWSHVLRSAWPDPGTFQRAVETIERNARAQEQLVSDVLDVSRIVSGKLRLDLQPVDMAAVVDGALAAVGPTADARGVGLEHTLDRGAAQVLGDRDRLQQVVWNLLSNAIKFTPTGGRVTVLLKRVGEELALAVQDSGSGIDPELLPHVFERFRQADSSTTRKHGGLGLGLALVRHLVELHGGSVCAESEGPGRGSRFTVCLRLFGAQVTAAEPTPGEMTRTPLLTGLHVVLVEDDADAREGLALILQGRGAKVTAVGSAGDAFTAVSRDRPDVLVADIAMPDEDGYGLIRKVRSLGREGGGRVPAIAVSGYATPQDRAHALLEGFDMHLAKPLHVPELVVGISNLARSRER